MCIQFLVGPPVSVVEKSWHFIECGHISRRNSDEKHDKCVERRHVSVDCSPKDFRRDDFDVTNVKERLAANVSNKIDRQNIVDFYLFIVIYTQGSVQNCRSKCQKQDRER